MNGTLKNLVAVGLLFLALPVAASAQEYVIEDPGPGPVGGAGPSPFVGGFFPEPPRSTLTATFVMVILVEGLADHTTFDTIDNAPWERERGANFGYAGPDIETIESVFAGIPALELYVFDLPEVEAGQSDLLVERVSFKPTRTEEDCPEHDEDDEDCDHGHQP